MYNELQAIPYYKISLKHQAFRHSDQKTNSLDSKIYYTEIYKEPNFFFVEVSEIMAFEFYYAFVLLKTLVQIPESTAFLVLKMLIFCNGNV